MCTRVQRCSHGGLLRFIAVLCGLLDQLVSCALCGLVRFGTAFDLCRFRQCCLLRPIADLATFRLIAAYGTGPCPSRARAAHCGLLLPILLLHRLFLSVDWPTVKVHPTPYPPGYCAHCVELRVLRPLRRIAGIAPIASHCALSQCGLVSPVDLCTL